MEFRDLTAGEIEVRVSRVTNAGVELLLYKTSRTDMDILDETVGPERWECRYEDHKGTLFCGVGIKTDLTNDFSEWVWKWDAGAPSNMEAQKGEASDAFKRACTKWGIGRELYTAPRIFVRNSLCSIVQGRNGKSQCYDNFVVERIGIEDGRIVGVRIRNKSNGMVAFSWKEE